MSKGAEQCCLYWLHISEVSFNRGLTVSSYTIDPLNSHRDWNHEICNVIMTVKTSGEKMAKWKLIK